MGVNIKIERERKMNILIRVKKMVERINWIEKVSKKGNVSS